MKKPRESMGFDYTFATFGAGELERISGLSGAMQRDLRRRGLIGGTEGGGRARFDIVELATIWMMTGLASQGAGPKASRSLAELLGRLTVDRLLRVPGAIGGEPLTSRSQVPDAYQLPEYMPLDKLRTHWLANAIMNLELDPKSFPDDPNI
jgi:hypothetical protein